MKNLFLISIIITLILFNIILLYQNVHFKHNIKFERNAIQQLSIKQYKDSIAKIVLLKNVVEQLKNSSIIVDPNMVIEDFNNNKYNINKLINGHPKLVFMFSELNCQTCVDMQLPNLKKLAKEIGTKNIILLASYNNKRDLLQFKRINKIDFDIYNLELKSLKFPILQYNVPFFFILDKNFVSTCFFIPDKTLPNYTQGFFNIIKSRFFEGN